MTMTHTNPKAMKDNGNAAAAEKPKQTRTRKPVTPRSAAVKIADILEKLPADQREKALALAKALGEAT